MNFDGKSIPAGGHCYEHITKEDSFWNLKLAGPMRICMDGLVHANPQFPRSDCRNERLLPVIHAFPNALGALSGVAGGSTHWPMAFWMPQSAMPEIKDGENSAAAQPEPGRTHFCISLMEPAHKSCGMLAVRGFMPGKRPCPGGEGLWIRNATDSWFRGVRFLRLQAHWERE
jgi:hypothetical protein